MTVPVRREREALGAQAGQVLVAGFSRPEPPAELLAETRRGQLGGFVLFSRNIRGMQQVAELNRRLIRAAPHASPPVIAVDQEGGRVSRLGRPVLQLPPMRVLGSLEPELTQEAARVLGRQLRKLGFSANLAPVLDVDTHAANPVIGDRSFGREPQTVVCHGLALAKGLQEAGIAACGKHFPGHGDTQQDSHLELPVVGHSRQRLDRVELMPFKAAVGHVSSIMTAHVVFQAIDGQWPATLSRKAVCGVLRKELGFDGVVVSDDLEMGAIAGRWGIGEAACRAIDAGCDMLLVCSDVEPALLAREALIRRAENDSSFGSRLARAAGRSLAWRRRFAPKALSSRLDAEVELLSEQPEAVETRLAAAVSLVVEKG